MTTPTSLPTPGVGGALAATGRTQLASILVATDGTPTSDGAFRAAKLLAEATGAAVHVISVLEPQPLVVPSPDALAPPVDLSESFAARRSVTVGEQMERMIGVATAWPTEIRFGRPAAVIAEAAREHGAGLIVAGLNHHNPLERLVRGDTPLQVGKLADVPLLAVPRDFTRFPRTVVVAVDLTPSSIRAAESARPLLRDVATLHLAHVKPRVDVPTEVWTGWERAYEEAEREAFIAVAAALALPPDLAPMLTTVSGSPAREIIRFAQVKGADLIVAGHSRRSFLDRILGGSVAAKLYRGAACSILIVPDATPAGAGWPAFLGHTETVRDPAMWPALFREFNYRNAARRATLEVDDSDFGAQAEARDYVLLGVDYDPRDRKVEVMLGDLPPGPRHLTHVVANPISVDVLRSPDGRDRVLHIAREGGQTLVTLA